MKKAVSLFLSIILIACLLPQTVHSADPALPEGLLVWYDAMELNLPDGAGVENWNCKTNPDYDALQNNPDNRPVYTTSGKLKGKPAVKFSKSSYLQLKNKFNLDDMSIFAVVYLNSTEGGIDDNQIFSKLQHSYPGNHNWYFNIKDKGFNFGWKDAGGYIDYNGANRHINANTGYMLGGTKTGNVGALYINGTKLGETYGNVQNPKPLTNNEPIYIGGRGPQGEAWSIDGEIYEILVFDRGLTFKECGIVNAYFSKKWGIKAEPAEQPAGSIYIDGSPLRPFSPKLLTYKHTLPKGTTNIPQVTADFGGPVTVTQATSLPGTATVKVENGGTYTIQFEVLDQEVTDLKQPELEQVEVLDGFWKNKLDLFANTTVKHVLDNLENSGSVVNFDNIANGTNHPTRTSPWNDGLLFEAIRGAADFLRKYPNPQIIQQIDGYIERIYKASLKSPNGYLSTVAMMEKPGLYFDQTGDARWYHDAYNFGCMAEASVNYYKATGGSEASLKLLFVVTRFAEFIVENYGYGTKPDGTPKANMVPSHQGPEEMLLKLYRLYRDNPQLKTQIEQYSQDFPLSIDPDEYAELVKFWLENRGIYKGRENSANYGVYAQDHAVYFNQTKGAGHAVRANLFYTGLAAAGREFHNHSYLNAAKTLYDNITKKQMYITGGVGADPADRSLWRGLPPAQQRLLRDLRAGGNGLFQPLHGTYLWRVEIRRHGRKTHVQRNTRLCG